MRLWLRILCWWNDVCYKHKVVKGKDGFGFSLCRDCYREAVARRFDKYKEEDRRRSEFIEKLKKRLD